MIVIQYVLDTVRHVAMSIFSSSVAYLHSYHVFQRADILNVDEVCMFSFMVCVVWMLSRKHLPSL